MAAFRGLDRGEPPLSPGATPASGDTLQRSEHGRPRVDKHSTGGVGDKVSLVLAPLAARLRRSTVPMTCGRGRSATPAARSTSSRRFPASRTRLTLAEAARAARSARAAPCSAGDPAKMAPADRKLYALRDATGTVESVPLIAASSIMSKKLAEGLDWPRARHEARQRLLSPRPRPAARVGRRHDHARSRSRLLPASHWSPRWIAPWDAPVETPWRSRRRSSRCAAKARPT